MVVTSFKLPPLFRKPKISKFPRDYGSGHGSRFFKHFLLTLQDILNPDLSLMFRNLQEKNNIPDFHFSYYCGRTIVIVI